MLLDYILEPPSYGWKDENGNVVKPTPKQILKEFLSRVNVFADRKNYLSFLGWFWVLCLLPFMLLFITKYITIPLFIVGFIYSMVCMGSHGTIWYHRYCTHRAYKFSNKFWQIVTQNLVIRLIPEETYVVSHHVHHLKSELPGDPYNAQCGFLYCFFADSNHQPVNRNLSEDDYATLSKLLDGQPIVRNTYEQYKKWGSICAPLPLLLHWVANWSFWFAAYYFLGEAIGVGGMALACTIFGWAFVWGVGIRTFNYDGHGQGEDKKVEGIDFHKKDNSINQLWPGFVAGEWHNNHHLYPTGARSGFLPYQFDTAWIYIKSLSMIGAVTEYNDYKKEFLETYYKPYLSSESTNKATKPYTDSH